MGSTGVVLRVVVVVWAEAWEEGEDAGEELEEEEEEETKEAASLRRMVFQLWESATGSEPWESAVETS